MAERPKPLHVSIVTLPESSGIPVHGMYEGLSLVGTVVGDTESGVPRFVVETVGPKPGVHRNAYGLPVEVQRTIDEVSQTDIVIIGAIIPSAGRWDTGRYPETIEWLRSMYDGGSCLASACTGAFLLAETGLLDGQEATTHWAFAPDFRRTFPQVQLRIEELLLRVRSEPLLLTAGGSSAWQDLILELIARYDSPASATALARFLLYRSMRDTQAPYISLPQPVEHNDDKMREVQGWVQDRFAAPGSVEAMIRRSELSPRTFQRRFKEATGLSPLSYVQSLRVEEAKRLLACSSLPIDRIAIEVGYQEPASFRRVFKRLTRISPGEYRRMLNTSRAS